MSKKWDELSVLIAGCGSIGKRHARVLESLGVADVRACDPRAAGRDEMAGQSPGVRLYESYDDGLADGPDTVLLCTPPAAHIPMAIQAMRNGCHVLTEKPLADTTERADELAEVARREDKKVMVALCFRYHVGVLKAREVLKAGRVGRLIAIRAFVGEYLPEIRPNFLEVRSAMELGVFDLIHDLDLALWLADLPVKSVKSLVGNYSDIGLDGPDLAELLIDFDGPCAAAVHLDYFQRPRRRSMELMCSGGLIALDLASWDRCTFELYEADSDKWCREEIQTDRDDMFRDEDREFLQAVAEDRPIKCTIEESLRSLKVVEAAMGRGGQ